MSEKRLYCSFCGKSQDEVAKLIAGASAFICHECVDLCHDIPHGKPTPPAEPPFYGQLWRLLDAAEESLRALRLFMNGSWYRSAPAGPATSEVVNLTKPDDELHIGFGPREPR